MTMMSTTGGILKEAPCGGDICVQFKGVFMRNLALLYRTRPATDLQTFMRHQSDQLWNVNRNAQSQFGYEWDLPFDKATASRQSSALDALVAGGSRLLSPTSRSPSSAPRPGLGVVQRRRRSEQRHRRQRALGQQVVRAGARATKR